MSEYIPTTEEMRESIYPGVRHLFDRWLAKEKGGSYRTGMKVREEQIIWLLEARITECANGRDEEHHVSICPECCGLYWGIDELKGSPERKKVNERMAAIRGEKNE